MSEASPSRTPQPASDEPKSWLEWLVWIVTEDHCEWANRYVYWLKTPLGILLVGAVSSLLCGLFFAPQGFVLLAAIGAVIGVGLVWPAVAIRGVHCQLVFTARRGREGQPATAKLVVTNRWPWPVWGLAIADPLLSGEGESALALARIEGWTTATFNFALTPSRRGVYPNREVRFSTGFPFGLYQASGPTELPRRLIVWPQTFWLPPLGAAASRPHWRGAPNDRLPGHEGTRLGVRDHRAGDSLRDVHWAKTARYDRLIISERESATIEEVAVFVDVDPANHAGEGGDSTLEWSLRIAASICESVAANHGQVELWLGGEKLAAPATADGVQHLMDKLAEFAPRESPRRGLRTSGAASGLAVEVGTDATAITAARSIVLRRRGFDPRAPSASGEKRHWIQVESPGDVPDQVLRGWRPGVRRVDHAR